MHSSSYFDGICLVTVVTAADGSITFHRTGLDTLSEETALRLKAAHAARGGTPTRR